MQNDTGQAGIKEGDGGIYGRKQQKGKTKKRMVTGYRGMGRENVPTLMREAQDRNRWRIIVMHAVDTNGWKPMDLE